MKQTRTVLLLVVLLTAITGCTVRAPEITPTACPVDGPVFTGQWYSSGHTYRMRHEGVLSFGSTTLPLTALMLLDSDRRTARVAILTGMGIKLLTLDVTPDGHHVLSSSPAAEKIPGFMEGAPEAIRAVFLPPFPTSASYCGLVDNQLNYVEENRDGPVRFRVDDQTGALLSKAGTSWNAIYGPPVSTGADRMPGDIEFTDRSKRFSVILKLISAQRQ